MNKSAKTFLKRLASGLLLALAALIAWQWELVTYGLGQGAGQFNVIWNAKPVEEYLNDNSYPDSLKAKIRLVQEIRSFAFDSLGLTPNKNYTTLFDQRGVAAQWMLTASEPYQMSAYEWSFPLIGSFSYKGYFNKTKAEAEAERLEALGYDTDIGEIGGWSTLGWLKDPILSDMLDRKEGSLSNLIIHELTHGTLYVKDNVEFNENLASFVGDKGALLFMEYKYGKNSRQAMIYHSNKDDVARFSRYVLKGSQKLDSLYKSFPDSMEEKEKKQAKAQMIEQICASMDTVCFNNQKRYYQFWDRAALPNNTFFMDFLRYREKQNQFEEEFRTKFNADFKIYMKYLKQHYKSL